MNDGDLDQSIERYVSEPEKEKRLGTNLEKRFENDEAHLDPSRWWFASSAFPLVAGTLGPVASAFSICALVRPWRQILGDGNDLTTRLINSRFHPDPPWLTVVNAIQLVMAIASNMALLLNMAHRLRFAIAQPVTITGWYLSAICLAALLGTAEGPLDLSDTEFVWSQAFWYGMWAAILYFVCASLMVVTVYGSYTKHYAQDFDLTTSQRTLMLQTILFLMYLLVGAVVFSKLEGWQYFDGLYWADVTLFTVGFGDILVETTAGRALLIPYALVGVISLGLVIGSIRSLVLERGKRKIDARMVEKRRRRVVRNMTVKGRDQMLEPIRSRTDTFESGRDRSPSNEDENDQNGRSDANGSCASEFDRRRQEFILMRKIQDLARRRRRWMALATSLSTWLVLWLVGAKIFQEAENAYQDWNYFDGFYFAFVTLTTIGYGDRTPFSNCGKSFFVFWSLLALPTMTVLISNAGDTVVKAVRDMTLALGNVTILPGDKGFRKDAKVVLRSLSCGQLFADDEDVEDIPPGFLGQARERNSNSDSDDDADAGNDAAEGGATTARPIDDEVESKVRRRGHDEAVQNAGKDKAQDKPAGGGPIDRVGGDASSPRHDSASRGMNSSTAHLSDAGTYAKHLDRSLKRHVRDPSAPLPTDPAIFHYLLVCEIAAVTQDLGQHPPKRYSFAEWAWYLKLIGEDESSADTHRKAQPHRHQHKSQRQCHCGRIGHHNHHHTLHREASSISIASYLRNRGRRGTAGSSAGGSTAAAAAAPGQEASGEAGAGTEARARSGSGCGSGLLGKRKVTFEGETKAQEEEEQQQWSWVGSKSPLMGSQEEAEWILERLTERLREGLAEEACRRSSSQLPRDSRGTSRGAGSESRDRESRSRSRSRSHSPSSSGRSVSPGSGSEQTGEENGETSREAKDTA